MTSETEKATNQRVLLLEDEYFIADDMARALTASGVEVVGPVATVGAAMELIARSDRLDGAVLDINLRGETVYPVAEALEARGVPFIFATGYDEATIPPRFAGVRRCEKPVDPGRVAKALFRSA
ncbi:MAG TPA: response regulator [Acetobacteraceae bacterium]|nr:response regulator [Acetobacteraceae bacterium]